MPAKKPKQQQNPKLNDDLDTITISSGGSGLGASSTFVYGPGATVGGISYDYSTPYTISIDPMAYSTTSGTITPSWTSSGASTSSYTISSTPTWGNVSIDGNGITMKENADITFGGKSLMQSIAKIEERLGILHPNPELESRWESLKELKRQYDELEKDLLEKEKMWKILKEK
jgi:hypothetical protein